MLVGQSIGVAVFVAIDATKEREIARCGVALRTGIPLIAVLARIDREIVIVVVGERCGHPAIVVVVAKRTIGREAELLVVGVGSVVVVVQVTAGTFGREPLVGAVGVAFGTTQAAVPAVQRKEQVKLGTSGPSRGQRVVAHRAVHSETGLLVIGLAGRHKIWSVALCAVGSQALEGQFIGALVTFGTGGGEVHTVQRESVCFVQFLNPGDQPMRRRMATEAVVPNGVFVHVSVARNTSTLGLGKIQLGVALYTRRISMATFEGKAGGGVVPFQFLNGPTIGVVALGTVEVKTIPVGRFLLAVLSPNHRVGKDRKQR